MQTETIQPAIKYNSRNCVDIVASIRASTMPLLPFTVQALQAALRQVEPDVARWEEQERHEHFLAVKHALMNLSSSRSLKEFLWLEDDMFLVCQTNPIEQLRHYITMLAPVDVGAETLESTYRDATDRYIMAVTAFQSVQGHTGRQGQLTQKKLDVWFAASTMLYLSCLLERDTVTTPLVVKRFVLEHGTQPLYVEVAALVRYATLAAHDVSQLERPRLLKALHITKGWT